MSFNILVEQLLLEYTYKQYDSKSKKKKFNKVKKKFDTKPYGKAKFAQKKTKFKAPKENFGYTKKYQKRRTL